MLAGDAEAGVVGYTRSRSVQPVLLPLAPSLLDVGGVGWKLWRLVMGTVGLSSRRIEAVCLREEVGW